MHSLTLNLLAYETFTQFIFNDLSRLKKKRKINGKALRSFGILELANGFNWHVGKIKRKQWKDFERQGFEPFGWCLSGGRATLAGWRWRPGGGGRVNAATLGRAARGRSLNALALPPAPRTPDRPLTTCLCRLCLIFVIQKHFFIIQHNIVYTTAFYVLTFILF